MDHFVQLLKTQQSPEPHGSYGGMRVFVVKRIPVGLGQYREETLINAGGSAPHNPASTTKLMTGLMAFEARHDGQLPATLTISPHAMLHNESEEYRNARVLAAGDTIKTTDATSAMLVGSDNVAAAAHAEALGKGNTPAERHHHFVRRMNQRAAEIGMHGTRFINASGMNLNRSRDNTSQEAVTTAADMAKLITHIYDTFPIDAHRYLEQSGHRYGRLFQPKRPNHRLNDPASNSYILDLPGLHVGTKTGWISLSKHNSVTMLTAADGSQLVVVVMGADRMPEAKALSLVRKEDLPDRNRLEKPNDWDETGVKGSKIRDALVERIVRHYILVSGEERDLSTFRFAGEDWLAMPKIPVVTVAPTMKIPVPTPAFSAHPPALAVGAPLR